MSTPKQPENPGPDSAGPGNPQPPQGENGQPANRGIPEGMADAGENAKGRPTDDRNRTESAPHQD